MARIKKKKGMEIRLFGGFDGFLINWIIWKFLEDSVEMTNQSAANDNSEAEPDTFVGKLKSKASKVFEKLSVYTAF